MDMFSSKNQDMGPMDHFIAAILGCQVTFIGMVILYFTCRYFGFL